MLNTSLFCFFDPSIDEIAALPLDLSAVELDEDDPDFEDDAEDESESFGEDDDEDEADEKDLEA